MQRIHLCETQEAGVDVNRDEKSAPVINLNRIQKSVECRVRHRQSMLVRNNPSFSQQPATMQGFCKIEGGQRRPQKGGSFE